MRKYYRFTVDRWSPETKLFEHTVELTSATRDSDEHNEVIARPEHTFVDEVVISPWLHIEAMDKRTYWMNVAGVTLWVRLRKNGSAKSVSVHSPGGYDEPHANVRYEMDGDDPMAVVREDRAQLQEKIAALTHSPACPGEAGCWCPVGAALALVKEEPWATS